MAETLLKILKEDFLEKVADHSGLSVFAEKRAKFEGWLKVELIEILSRKGYNPIPEFETFDIKCDLGLIELKTINTNYTHPLAEDKGKPITKNVESVVSDIYKLKNYIFENKYVAFVVFPLEHNNTTWLQHYRKILNELTNAANVNFKFKNGVPGVFYCGKI